MRLLAVFDVLKHSATEDSTYAEEEEEYFVCSVVLQVMKTIIVIKIVKNL